MLTLLVGSRILGISTQEEKFMDIFISIAAVFWLFMSTNALQKENDTSISGYTLFVLIVNVVISFVILVSMIVKALTLM